MDAFVRTSLQLIAPGDEQRVEDPASADAQNDVHVLPVDGQAKSAEQDGKATSQGQAAQSGSTFDLMQVPFEGLLAGGVVVAFLVAFVAHRIAQSQRETSRWLLIVGCAIIAGAGVFGLVRWADQQGTDGPRLAAQPPLATAERTTQERVYYRQEYLDDRYAQQSEIDELKSELQRSIAEATNQSERLERKLTSINSETERKLADLEKHAWAPDTERKIATQLADLEDQVDLLRRDSQSPQRAVTAYPPIDGQHYSSTSSPYGYPYAPSQTSVPLGNASELDSSSAWRSYGSEAPGIAYSVGNGNTSGMGYQQVYRPEAVVLAGRADSPWRSGTDRCCVGPQMVAIAPSNCTIPTPVSPAACHCGEAELPCAVLYTQDWP